MPNPSPTPADAPPAEAPPDRAALRNAVLADLLASPWSLVPAALGATALLGSWAVGGDPGLTFAGVAGFLGAGGAVATRWIYGLEALTQRAWERLTAADRRRRDDELDALDAALARDGDLRTHRLLRELRALRSRFHADARSGKLAAGHGRMLGQVDELFAGCVTHLRNTLELKETARRVGNARREVLEARRDALIGEVAATAEHLAKTVDRVHGFAAGRQASELSRLREELDETMAVARRTEERMAELDRPVGYDPAEFE